MFMEYRKEMKILFDNIAQLVMINFVSLFDFQSLKHLIKEMIIFNLFVFILVGMLTWCWSQFITFRIQHLGEC